MRKAVLVTGHYWGSRRKAGFHWIAESLAKQGWDVLFMTTALSWFSVLRNDHRLAYGARSEAGRLVPKQEGVTSFVWFTNWHPANLRWESLNRSTIAWFRKYANLECPEVEDWVKQSSLIIFESMAGLLLHDKFRRLNERARYVYRVSDDLHLLKCHPVVSDYEARNVGHFDLISVPSAALARRFTGYAHVQVHHHGIDKTLFDRPFRNPYGSNGTNAVFVGVAHVDYNALTLAARLRPEWTFHLLGPLRSPTRLPNLREYGELPFRDTIAYLKHGDIGLQTLEYKHGAESFSDSLKVIQYTYCRLPILAPSFLATRRSHVFHYAPGDCNSLDQALDAAKACDRSSIDVTSVQDWGELTTSLAGHA